MVEIHGIRPGTKVILTSGFNEEAFSERISSDPPDGFIRKPYTMSVLQEELLRVIQSQGITNSGSPTNVTAITN